MSATESMKKVEPAPIAATLPYGERMLASTAYFAALAGMWLVVPVALYFWKGRQSRFIGFHAIQAVLLQVVLIPVLFIGIGVSFALGAWVTSATHDRYGNAPLAELVTYAVAGIAYTIPIATTLWLGLCALRGQPRTVPLLGRWAKRIAGEI